MSFVEGWLDAADRLEEQALKCKEMGERLARKDPRKSAEAFLAYEHITQAIRWLRSLADTEPTQPNARPPGPPPIPTR